MEKKFKVALALGGGGARGFAHIGVIRILKEHSIPIDMIVGTSMGALIGGLYCLELDENIIEQRMSAIIERPPIRELESLFAYADEEDQRNLIIQKLLSKIKDICIWNLRAAKRWIVRNEPIEEIFRDLFGDKTFADMQIPFVCTAVDLNDASEVAIESGKIADAILASSSIPGIFSPVKLDNRLLADGGILSSVPAKQAHVLGADFVIGIDISPKVSNKRLLTGLDIMYQADQIKSFHLNQINLKYCDWVIRPKTFDIGWSEFSKLFLCIQEGERQTSENIADIKAALDKKRRFYPFKKLISQFKGERYVD